METKVTVRKIKSSEYRASTTQKAKQDFVLFGRVLKTSEKSNSVLVEKGGSTTSFWISCYDKINQLVEGKCYRFTINISSFIMKMNSDYTTHLSIKEFVELPESEIADVLPTGLDTAIIPANILSSQKTDIPGLYILTAARMKDGEEMEHYHFRYFAEDRLHPDLGTAMIKFTINKCKDVINSRGESNVYLETRSYINSEGEEITVESPRFKPCLSILEIIR